MKAKVTGLAAITVIVALGLAFAGAPLAQTTTTQNVRNFEVISVDGNKLVARDENGTEEITVPDDFRFTVDGKKVPVSDLKPGMKGTATITTKTTVTPVFVTEVKEGVVLRAMPRSITVRGTDGLWKKYTQEQVDGRDIQIFRGGRAVRMSELHEGDVLTATIVSKGPPEVVTEKEVQATVAESKAAPAPTMAAAAPAAQPPAAAPAPQPSAPPPAMPAAEPSGLGPMGYLLIAVIIALVLFFVMRKRKAP